MTTKSSKVKLEMYHYSRLAKEIKSGMIRPVYLLTGEEEYLLSKILSGIKKRVLAEGAGEADSYLSDRSNGGIDPEELKSLIYTPPFISDKRVTVLKNTGLFSSRYPESGEVQEAYASVFDGIPEFACMIFLEAKIDKRKKGLLNIISSKGVIADIGRQTEGELSSWISGLLKRENIRITVDAVNSLIDRTEKQMGLIEKETQKIILYCIANSVFTVDIDVIDQICVADLRGSVFKMIDAIGMRKTEEALMIFDKLVSLREPIPKIRFLLARHVRHLICAKELQRADALISRLKLMPFVARNLVSQSRMFSKNELLVLYDRCHRSDVLVKSGKMDDRHSLEWILFSLDCISDK
ncbi:MAG: DNA polymerase III subunit delta [Clostridiales bacterium]|nr:DNA polymerase III subunit delta [Clostridiales bacterium]